MMFGEFSNRELMAIIAAMLIAGALVAAGSVYVTKTFLIGDRSDDPLSRQGGLKPEQAVPAK
jgi:hypothetical protein